MATKDKVIKGFESCVDKLCNECPYKNVEETICIEYMMLDALEVFRDKIEDDRG